jgi:hypothetical protein
MVKPDEVTRVIEFRERLVAYANYVTEHVHGLGYGGQVSARVRTHIGEEQSWLAQEYGAIHKTIARYGTAMMTQFGGIASQDAVRDAIGSPTHPSYADLARFAIGHLDTIIGRLRAEAASRRVSMDDVYRATSPVFWIARLLAGVRRLLSTTRGRIVAAIGAVILVLIGAFAQAFFTKFLG